LVGKVVFDVSPKVSFLICGENPGKKLEDARKLGIGILDKDKFKNLVFSGI
jgi:NAD-dependent DNA ligase